jgi:hypothetical protein
MSGSSSGQREMGNTNINNLRNLKRKISGRHTSSGCEDNNLMDLKEICREVMG